MEKPNPKTKAQTLDFVFGIFFGFKVLDFEFLGFIKTINLLPNIEFRVGPPGFEPESQRPERHRIDQATPRAQDIVIRRSDYENCINK